MRDGNDAREGKDLPHAYQHLLVGSFIGEEMTIPQHSPSTAVNTCSQGGMGANGYFTT